MAVTNSRTGALPAANPLATPPGASGRIALPLAARPGSHPASGGPVDPARPGRPSRAVNLAAIAEGFARSAGELTHLAAGPERQWVLLAVTDLFEAWAIGWPPGGNIELHDHGRSSGAVVVARGNLVETTVSLTSHGHAVAEQRGLALGDLTTFGSGHIHDIVNRDTTGAISVHVYGPKLRSMTYYRLEAGGRLATRWTVPITPVGPFDVTRDLDPS